MIDGRIDRIEITPLAFSDPPLLNAAGVHEPYVLRALVEVFVDDGRGGIQVGLGECVGHSWQLDWLQLVAPRLVGASVFDLAQIQSIVDIQLTNIDLEDNGDWRIWSDRNPAQSHGPAPLPASEFDRRRVYSALEVACHDAIGRLVDLPVAELLGGRRRPIVDYAGYLFYKLAGHIDISGETVLDEWGAALNPTGIVDQATRMIDLYGFRSLKLKGGVFDPHLELRTLQELRRAFPHMPLRADPNAALTLSTAMRLAPHIGRLLEYWEDPVAGQADMAALARATGITLATNMCVVSLKDIWPAALSESVAVVLADHHYWDGLRGVMVLDAICQAAGLGISMHSNSHLGVSLAAMTHVAAAARVAHACDTHYPWNAADDIVPDGQLTIRDGSVRVPDRPGLGIEIDRTVVKRLNEQYLALGREHRDDQSYARRLGVETVVGPLPRW